MTPSAVEMNIWFDITIRVVKSHVVVTTRLTSTHPYAVSSCIRYIKDYLMA